MLKTMTAESALPDHKISLEIVLPVMLLRNVDPLRVDVCRSRYITKAVYFNLFLL